LQKNRQNKFIVAVIQRGGPLLVILPCAVIAFLCQSFFDTFFFSYQLASFFWVLMALTVANRIIFV
jgi:hypothetical protein